MSVLVPHVITAQAVFQGTSNLPQDRFVNTFHFEYTEAGGVGVTEAAEDEIVTRLTAFYNSNYPTYGIHTYLSALVDRTANKSEFRLYYQGEAEPREPHITNWTLGAIDSGGRLPTEVALCASFFSIRNIPHQRGRIYLGPFEIGANDSSVGRPTTLLRQTVANAMEALAGSNDVVTWSTLSRTTVPPAAGEVTAGWVDNEWDTQRRRGLEVTSRITWEA